MNLARLSELWVTALPGSSNEDWVLPSKRQEQNRAQMSLVVGSQTSVGWVIRWDWMSIVKARRGNQLERVNILFGASPSFRDWAQVLLDMRIVRNILMKESPVDEIKSGSSHGKRRSVWDSFSLRSKRKLQQKTHMGRFDGYLWSMRIKYPRRGHLVSASVLSVAAGHEKDFDRSRSLHLKFLWSTRDADLALPKLLHHLYGFT